MIVLISKSVLILITVVIKSSDCVPEIITESGRYSGVYRTSPSGFRYSAFLGVQFARVVERFKEAVPMAEDETAWHNATKFGRPCYQRSSKDVGIEDCLFLNVYTPDVEGNLPVLFFIYGGAFAMGTTLQYDPEYFMETKKIVVVTAAYRVGPFGFLYFDDEEYPANLGLRDQIQGLQWVQKNIRKFGGDPTRVTLNGQSAGAASVNILMNSPLAKGLFVGAISQSGTACTPWALQPRCLGINRLRLLAMNIGCDGYLNDGRAGNWSAKPLVKCLNTFSAKEIEYAAQHFPLWDLIVPFPPIVERSAVKNPVITVFPWMTKSESVPWIAGVNADESSNLIEEYYPRGWLSSLSVRAFYGFILSDVLYFRFTSKHPVLTIADIKFHFIRDNIFNFKKFITEVLSLSFFLFPNYQCLQNSRSLTYSYYFNYRQESGKNSYMFGSGVGHGEELAFLWKEVDGVRSNGSKSDVEISNNLVDSWIHFAYHQSAKYSNVTWNRYSIDKDNMLIIDKRGARMERNPHHDDSTFWSSLATNQDPSQTDCYP